MFPLHVSLELDMFQGPEMAFVDKRIVQCLRILCLVRNYNHSNIQPGYKPSPSAYSREIFREGPGRATRRSVLTKIPPSRKPSEDVLLYREVSLLPLHVCRLAVIRQVSRYLLDDFRH
jgi:hypothetical protein